MTLPLWIALGIVAVVVGLIVWQVVRAVLKLRAANARWKSLRGIIPFSYASDGAVSEEILERTVSRAALALTAQGPWDASLLLRALAGVRVFIASEESWSSIVCTNTDCRDGKIAGATLPASGMIVVNASLSSVCHELAHVAELKLDGAPDYLHATWGARGINTAVASFLRVYL